MRYRTIKCAIVAGLLLAATYCARSTQAALTLVISEPGAAVPPAPITVTDMTNSGNVSYNGTFGDFQTTLDFGYSNKTTASGAQQATLEITSIDITSLASSGNAETLVLTLTDNGFTFPGTSGSTLQLGSAITGTFTPPTGTEGVSFQSFETTTNSTTGLQTAMPSLVPPIGQFNSVATPVSFNRGTTYGLENVTSITLAGGADLTDVSGSTTVTATSSSVPEPMTAGLVLVGGAIVSFYRPRRSPVGSR
jgi:hypothetical protein